MRVAVSVCILTAIIFSACPLFGAASDSAPRKTGPVITKDAVWNIDKLAVQAAKQRCTDPGDRRVEDCFIDAMQNMGASPEALAFTRCFGGGAFVRRFRETGRVDIAYIVYPFRANENSGVLLVNGDPPIMDVDEMYALPTEAMEQDKTFMAIRKAYPKVTIWPGDRSPRHYPVVEALPEGGQAFIIPYTLRNLCHACDVVGTAFFSFDFDREGKYIGIRFLRAEPAAKKTVKTEARKENEQIRFVVMVEEGKEFTVRLSANRTTGYQWRPAGSLDERIVKLVRSEYVVFDPGRIGGGGEEVWTFLAVGRGDTEITMEYVRPWEKGQHPVKTATIKVSVRPR